MNQISGIPDALLAVSLALSGCSSPQGHCDKGEAPVTMNDLPPAVRSTLDRESKPRSGKVTEVEEELKHGSARWHSADVTINGKEWDVAIAEDGTLLSKKLDDDDEKK